MQQFIQQHEQSSNGIAKAVQALIEYFDVYKTEATNVVAKLIKLCTHEVMVRT